SDAPQNLVAGNARVDGGHGTPLIANLVEVGVANSAEENLDLYVVRGWIAPRDDSGRNGRCLAGGGVGFRVVHRSNVGCSVGFQYAEHAILYAEYARFWSLAHRKRASKTRPRSMPERSRPFLLWKKPLSGSAICAMRRWTARRAHQAT